MSAPLPADEAERLAALHEQGILDTPPSEAFDDIARLAACICGTPIAAVSLVDDKRQWFKSILGLDVLETPRSAAFCAHTILQPDLTIVPDAMADERFAANPLVTSNPNIRFYAGAPLVTDTGHALGSLCVLDQVPRYLTPDQQEALRALARQVMGQMRLVRQVAVQQRLITERERAEQAHRHSEEKFRSIIASSPVAYALNDEHQNITFLNDEFARIFGYTLNDIPTLAHWWPRAYPNPTYRDWVSAAWQQRLAKAKQHNTPFETLEIVVRCKNGSDRTVLASASPLGESFAGTHLVCLYDITDRRRAQDEKADLMEYNRLLLESTAEGIYGMDMQGHCTFINKAACSLIGYTAEEALGQGMHALIHHSREDGSCYPVEDSPIYKAFQQGTSCHVDTEVLWRRDGTSFQAAYSSYPMTRTEGIVGAVVTFSDISERRQAELEKEQRLAEAQAFADRDPLTGLVNHRAFHNDLKAEAARASHEHSSLAVVMLDLDNFKFFNDVYGHATGDEVLRLVAGKLKSVCRVCDTLARFGGDEFALLLLDVDHTTAEQVEARLRADLQGLFYHVGGREEAIPVSISVGAALFPDADMDYHDVLRRADERLRWSKTGGGVEAAAQRVRADAGSRVEGFSMLDALVTAVDNKDRYTRKHSEDVMQYSLMIAGELGLDKAQQQTVTISALLHDVGKIGVPDAILRKPGRLTDDEFEAVKMHPQMGAIMVQSVPGLEATLGAVRHHHERWDGGGYPFGLREEETPLVARLMAVADAFSAMTTDRPYRKGISHEKALSILEAGAGQQWDPRCVQAFLKSMRKPSEAALPVKETPKPALAFSVPPAGDKSGTAMPPPARRLC